MPTSPAQARRAKYTSPEPQGLIPRPEKLGWLHRQGAAPITWVVGPPGAGKTSLAVTCLAAWAGHSLWFEVESGDGDPAVLFEHLAEAIRLASRRRSPPLPIYSPAHEMAFQDFIRRFFERAFSRIQGSSLWVLDNYHELPGDASSHNVLAEGLALLPHGSRVLVLSRQAPPAAFARLQAQGRLECMPWEELRMSAEEACALLEKRLPEGMDETQVQALCQLADGWPAGLVLLATEARRTHAPEVPSLDHETLFDYFAREVLVATPPEDQALLLQVSLFPSFSSEQAQTLTGHAKADTLLRTLNRSGYFTVAHGHPHPVYAFHPLFRAFLKRRAVDAFTSEEWQRLGMQVATMLEREGRIHEAQEVLREVGAREGLAGLIRRQGPKLLERGQYRSLVGWLGWVAPEVLKADPQLQLLMGSCLISKDPAASRRHLERAFTAFSHEGDLPGQMTAWCAVVDSWLYAWDDYAQLDPWMAWMDDHATRLSQISDPHVHDRVVVSMTWAIAHRRPTHPEAATWIQRAEHILRAGVHPQWRLRAGTAAFMCRFWAGEHHACELLVRDIRRLAVDHHEPMALITSYWAETGILVWNRTDPDRCRALIDLGLQEGRREGIHLFDFMFHGHAVSLALLQGELPQARQALAAMETCIHGKNSRAFFHYLSTWEAFVSGQIAAALSHAKTAVAYSEGSGMPSTDALNRLVLADLFHEMGQHDAAQDQAQLAAARVQQAGSPMIEMMFHQGMSRRASALGQWDETTRTHLAKALDIGKTHGFTHHLWEVPAWTAQGCLLALEWGLEEAYVHRLIRHGNLHPPLPPLCCPAWPWPLRILTLGRFAILRGSQEVVFPVKAPRTVLLLLKALVAAGPAGIPEARLADWVWPDAEGDAAKQSLDTTLHRLRKLLGVEGAILLREGRLGFDPARCWVDAHGFQSLVEAKVDGWLPKALELYRGPFLEELDGSWAHAYRDGLREKFLRTVHVLGQGFEAQGDYDQAIALYERGLEAAPSTESLYHRLVLAHHAQGHPAEALRAFERCRAALQHALHVQPSAALRALANTIRLGASQHS